MKHFSKFPALVLILVTLTACAGVSANVAESSKHRETNPSVQQTDMEALVDGNNTFALDIYQSLRTENGNLILSPYSISLALAMTYAGARGETESQMAQTLHFLPQEQLHPAFNALDLALEKVPANLDKDQEPMKLNIANAVWAEETYSFLPEFLDTIALNYGAGIRLADFINQFEAARKEINHWVSDKTEDKINDLLPQGVLDANTRMVLVNAIYFKADWSDQFDKDSTYEAPFHLLGGSDTSVETMHQNMYNIPYMQGNGFQAVELAYAGETAAMDIIVPDEGNFEALDSSLNKQTYDQIVHGMQPSSLQLGLPKFKFDKDFNLSDTLKSMGMPEAFESEKADFSGMTGNQDLYIGNVVHKAFVAVDEDGTEAAAATAVIMETTSAPMFEINLQIDRPFIFIIRDKVSGQVLFMGRVLNPAQ